MFDYGIVEFIVGKKHLGSMEYGVLPLLQNFQGNVVQQVCGEVMKVVRFAVVRNIGQRREFNTRYGLRFSAFFSENFYPTKMKCAPPLIEQGVA